MFDTTLKDGIVEVAMGNLITLSKHNEKINLSRFDIEDDGHKAVLKIALIINHYFGYKVYINCSLWNYIKVLKFVSDKKAIRWSIRPNGMSVRAFIGDLESPNNAKDIFKEIYNTYYKAEEEKVWA